MQFPIFAYLALLLVAGLLSSRLMKVLKLPNVTGYIITGILMGPFVFGAIFQSYDAIKDGIIYTYVRDLKWVSSVALGFIAFSIGTSFRVKTVKTLGQRVLIITVLEALGGSLLVFLSLMAAHFVDQNALPWEIVLTLSAIASATAPAATLMVIRQYRARGPFVDTLLPVVALDDAAALLLFAILFQIAKTLAVGGGFSVYAMIGKPLIEIALSLGFGVVLGLIITFANKFFKSRNNRLIWCIAVVFASLGLLALFQNPSWGGFELSPLLMCMMAGAFYSSLRPDASPTLDVLDRFTAPIYMMFFVFSGASLDLTVFIGPSGYIVLIIAGIYLFSRFLGKWLGAYSGARLGKAEPEVRRYLGFALVPQAGVAIGLATTASTSFGDHPSGGFILAVVLTSTLVYELVGPLAAKFALTKAGAIPKEANPGA